MPSLSITTYIKIAAVAVILAVGGYAYYQFQAMKSDLSDTRAQLEDAQLKYRQAASLAIANADQVKKADYQRQLVVRELESAQAEFESTRARANNLYFDLSNSPETDDGPVAPVLTRLQKALAGVK